MRPDAITLCSRQSCSIFRSVMVVRRPFVFFVSPTVSLTLWTVSGSRVESRARPSLIQGSGRPPMGRYSGSNVVFIQIANVVFIQLLIFKNYRGSSKMLRLEKDEKRPFQAFYLGHHTAIFTHIIRNGLHPSKNLISVDPFPFLRKAKKYTLFS